MKLLSKIFLAFGLLAIVPNLAHAQGVTRLCQESVNSVTGANNCVDVSATNPLNVTGGGGGGSAITAPLGTNPIAASVAVTPATSSLWAPAQGTTALSVTNGGFQNILQGNAVLSATNGLYTNLLQGNAVLSASNPIFASGSYAIGSTTSGQTGILGLCATVSGTSSYTTAQTNPCNLDTSGNLKVNIVAGSVGSVGSYSLNNSVETSPTLTASAYASGNGVGGFQTVAFFRAASNFSGLLTQVEVMWSGTETTGLTFYIFNKTIATSTCGDKAAVSLTAADLTNLATPPFTLTASATTGTTQTFASQPFAISMQNKDTSPGQNLYVCMVSNGVFTPGTTDLRFTISGIVD